MSEISYICMRCQRVTRHRSNVAPPTCCGTRKAQCRHRWPVEIEPDGTVIFPNPPPPFKVTEEVAASIGMLPDELLGGIIGERVVRCQ